MIDLNYISGFYPEHIRTNPSFAKHMVKEYVQLMVLNYLAGTPYIDKLIFIGGTNLRLVKGIDRWSEDLDFDCRNLTKEEFMKMTDGVVEFLRREGLNAETRDKDNPKLTAFRRSIHFPQLLFDLSLSGHKEERFLLKIEAQDQGSTYTPEIANINAGGFFFPLPVPPDSVLLSMKLSAMFTRAKGRDFYDVMFLMAQTEPDYGFLRERSGVGSPEELKSAVRELLSRTDMEMKTRDFTHLLFNPENSRKILRFADFIESRG